MIDSDVLTESDLGPDDDPGPWVSGRRVVRWVAILSIGILAVLAIWQDPLYAGR